MKVLLLQPPIRDFYDTEVRRQPLGLCSLKAALKREVPDADVLVRDYRQGWGRRTVAPPEALRDMEPYFAVRDRSPFSTFHAFFHFGADYDSVADDVAREEPDLVGISSLFSAYHEEVLRCAEAIKGRCQTRIVVGGAHATASPESLMASTAVDFVVRAEGEPPMVELVRALGTGGPLRPVPNLVWREGGALVANSVEANYPIERLPVPDFSDLGTDRYRIGRQPLAALTASRGCPHGCRFCSTHASFGRRHRRRPIEAVLEELRERYDDGYRAFDFEDDNLTLPRDEMAALCRGIVRAFPHRDVTLQAMNGVSYMSLDPELLSLMRSAGFTHLNLSLVSLDPGVHRTAGRPHSSERFEQVVEAAFGLGFRIVSYQILGFPGETVDSMIDTLVYGARLPVLLGASPFYLPPDAPMAVGLPAPSRVDLVRCRLTAMGPESTREPVYSLFVMTRILNFLKGLPVSGQRLPLSEALEIARGSGARAGLGADLLRRLLEEEILYAASDSGFVRLPRFRCDTFRSLWAKLSWIRTLDGGRIVIQ